MLENKLQTVVFGEAELREESDVQREKLSTLQDLNMKFQEEYGEERTKNEELMKTVRNQ